MRREFLGDTLAALPPRDMSLPPGTRAPTIEQRQGRHGTVGAPEDGRTPRHPELPSLRNTPGHQAHITNNRPQLHPYHSPPFDPILLVPSSYRNDHSYYSQLRESSGAAAAQQTQSRSSSVQATYAGSPIDTASTISASPGPLTPLIATPPSAPLQRSVEYVQQESAISYDPRRQQRRRRSFTELGEEELRSLGWEGLSEEHREFYRRLYEVGCLPGFPRDEERQEPTW